MGFLDNLGKKVTDAGQKTVQKTKELSDIARINSLITQDENKINNLYYQIGKLYAAMHGNNCEEEFTGMIGSIAELEQQIKDYRQQIQDIKGVQHCENCGAEVPRGNAFCSSCGTPMQNTQIQENQGEYLKCFNCGNLFKKGMRFCTSCGKPVIQMDVVGAPTQKDYETEMHVEAEEKVCPGCGARLTEDSVFCTECGKRL